MRSASLLVALAVAAASSVAAQDPFAGYSCDPSVCKLPSCRCATKDAPVANPPQFILLTFDDAVQNEVWPQANGLFSNRKNPNGCPARATWFAQVFYSDPLLITQWYAAGNEIADHTITHTSPFTGTYAEIEGNRAYMSTYGGVPRGQIRGFRYPFLNYTADSLKMLQQMGFEYESSMSAQDNDAVWPYTLDNGPVNDCLGLIGLCNKGLKVPGMWEVPLYGASGSSPHLMDPYNDPSITAPASTSTILNDLTSTFDRHYNGNRAPFGIYTHPIWIGPAVPPSIPDGTGKAAMVRQALDYFMSKPDTWMVTTYQLVQYMRNPVPASQLASQPYMQCTRNPAPPTNICNGLSTTGFETCNLPNGTIRSCYGCPESYPSLSNPVPNRVGSKCFIPDTCDTLWWDSVACKCLCTDASCAWNDTSRAINLDPSSLTQSSKPGSTGSGSGSGTGSGKGSNAGSALESATVATAVAAAIVAAYAVFF
ncbi:hypothetical protein HK105_203716 [Polyrhizophydium stewartii]|uniref:NodB homology domain-containing protein n=1 Tax=Polyrhizophydium stewartii TaxID=2732419 RepID=A0ABR4NAV9_9FUNG